MPKDFRASMLERAIGRKIAKWRARRGQSLTEAGQGVGFSNAKLSVMENALQPSNPLDIMALGYAYRVPVTEWQDAVRMAEVAATARCQGQSRSPLIDPSQDLNDAVSDAEHICIYGGDTLPVALHCDSYSRAVAETCSPILAAQYAVAREAMQKRLLEKSPPHVEIVVNETAIRTMVGTSVVMKTQLVELAEAVDRQNVTLQIVMDDAGANPAMMGSAFTQLRFPHRMHDDVVYVGNLLTGVYIEDPTVRAIYGDVFTDLQRVALGPQESIEVILAKSGALADGGRS